MMILISITQQCSFIIFPIRPIPSSQRRQNPSKAPLPRVPPLPTPHHHHHHLSKGGGTSGGCTKNTAISTTHTNPSVAFPNTHPSTTNTWTPANSALTTINITAPATPPPVRCPPSKGPPSGGRIPPAAAASGSTTSPPLPAEDETKDASSEAPSSTPENEAPPSEDTPSASEPHSLPPSSPPRPGCSTPSSSSSPTRSSGRPARHKFLARRFPTPNFLCNESVARFASSSISLCVSTSL